MKIRPVLISFFTICIILGVSAVIIAFGRGYRINFNKPTQLSPTGLVSATSDPIGAQVLVNGTIKTATNNSFTVTPGWYTVSLRKEGYIPWEKKLRVQGEVVTRADAYLFPTSPSLSPITTSGVRAVVLSPDGDSVAFFKENGLFTLELADRPLGGRNRDPKLIAEFEPSPHAELIWSPDSRSVIVSDGSFKTLYDLANPPKTTVLTPLRFAQTVSEWQAEKEKKNLQKLDSFKQPFIDVATSSAAIIAFSPDESKLLYEATRSAVIPPVIDPPLIGTNPTEESRAIVSGNIYVYDSREDRNYFIEESRKKTRFQWFPTNKHLLLTIPGKLDVMEYDRTNWTTLYSGPFEPSFVTPWPTGSRIVILTNLNPGAGTLPNLYTVNLR